MSISAKRISWYLVSGIPENQCFPFVELVNYISVYKSSECFVLPSLCCNPSPYRHLDVPIDTLCFPKVSSHPCCRVNLRNQSALSYVDHDKRFGSACDQSRETRIRKRTDRSANTLKLRVSASLLGSISSNASISAISAATARFIQPRYGSAREQSKEQALLIKFHIIERSIFSENRPASLAFICNRIYFYVQCQDNIWINNRDTKHRK